MVPPLLFGLRLWASVCLALYLSFWLKLDNAYWAGSAQSSASAIEDRSTPQILMRATAAFSQSALR